MCKNIFSSSSVTILFATEIIELESNPPLKQKDGDESVFIISFCTTSIKLFFVASVAVFKSLNSANM